MELITAKEARETARNLNESEYKQVFESIMTDIAKECNEGNFSLVYENKNFKSNIVTKLRELGYNVKTEIHRNDEYTTISWDV